MTLSSQTGSATYTTFGSARGSTSLVRDAVQVCLLGGAIHACFVGDGVNICVFGNLVGGTTHIRIFLEAVATLFGDIGSSGGAIGLVVGFGSGAIGLVVFGGRAIGLIVTSGIGRGILELATVVGSLVHGTHDEVQTSAGKRVQFVTQGAAFRGGAITGVEPFEEVIAAHTPEEEEDGDEGCEEDGWQQEEEGYADAEENEEDGGKKGDDESDDDGEDGDGDCE